MLIEVSGLRKTYQMGETIVPALRGVGLTIGAGEFVAIMGASGSGKSTLMHLLGLLDVPDGGSYKLLGREVSKLTQDELAQLRSQTIGFVFQQFNLLSRTSALDNVALPLIYNGAQRDLALAKELLEMVGLAGRLGHKPNELSGGQQQRVAIARALINRPKIIFADEPTGNLDSRSQEEIMEIFRKLNGQGITVVLVTHEEEVAAHARRVIKMKDGLVLSDERRADAGGVAVKTKTSTENQLQKISAWKTFLRESSEHFKQAGRALLANKVRTVLSMLGILIGVAAVIAMLALGSGAQESLQKQLASLGTNLLVLRPGSRRAGPVAMQAGAVTRFTQQDAKEIAAVPKVKNVAAEVNGRGQVIYGGKNWNTQVLGTVAEYAPLRAAVPTIGRFFSAEEDAQRARVAVVGKTIVRELFNNENPIGETLKINKINFQVIGILPEKGANAFRDQDDLIAIPLITAMRRVLGKEYVDNINIEVQDSESMDSVEDAVRAMIIRNHRLPPSQQDTFDIRNMADLQSALSETNRTMTWLLGSIAAISLLVGGIGIMNIMLVSVTERTKEIGLRKAVGARRIDILSQFLIESVVVSVLGGVLGLMLGAGVSYGMSAIAGWTTNVSLQSVVMAIAFSSLVGIGFGFWPAKKAAEMNPIEALRYE